MKRIETAYHEAGHLVALLYYHFKPTMATIVRDADILGSVMPTHRLRPDYSVEEEMEACFSGIKSISRNIKMTIDKK